jgi:lysophospholipase L1-like esterase
MKIILLGDSTIQTYPADRYPQTGWGQVFPRFLKREVEVLNFGKGGCSTKSFHDEGRLKSALTYLKAGDYVFIQFGHNDQKFEVYRKTEPFTSYLDYLKIYLNEIKNKGGNPVLLSSIYRRHFDANSFGK